MHLRALYLRNFRLHHEVCFEFSPHLNVISGPNAQGKTSLVEAIYFLISGRSFRTAQLQELIRHGSSSFTIEAHFVKHGIEQKLHIQCSGKGRKIIYNATQCTSSLSLLGILQGAIIHPDDAAIIKGPPMMRRHLLDLQLAQVDPLYVHYLTRYDRAMQQRNHLLRARSTASMDSWECEMANAAAYVVQQRAHLVEDLAQQGSVRYHQLCGGKEVLNLLYKPYGAGVLSPKNSPAIRTLYRENFQKHRPREMEIGSTLTGPHKDDFWLALNDKGVRSFGSEGQQRSCLIALRLAEWERLKATMQETPLMLVDDLGLSLDASRRTQMIEHFKTLGQVFLTTTEIPGGGGDIHEIRL